jgi:hypothetical protein
LLNALKTPLTFTLIYYYKTRASGGSFSTAPNRSGEDRVLSRSYWLKIPGGKA